MSGLCVFFVGVFVSGEHVSVATIECSLGGDGFFVLLLGKSLFVLGHFAVF